MKEVKEKDSNSLGDAGASSSSFGDESSNAFVAR